ncbi:MAG: glycosyltransferase family 4 protein [Gemmatimonadaceae bacterium]
MRHLFVTQDYGPDLGGIARRHVELCRRFAPDEVVVSTVASADAAAFDRGEPYRVAREEFAFAEAKRFLNQVRWSQSLVRQAQPSTGLLHLGNIRPCGYAVWMAVRRLHLPYVTYVYGGDVLRELRKTQSSPLTRATARAILGGTRGVVAISDWTADITRTLLDRLELEAPPPVAVIPLGTDPVQFQPSNDRRQLRRVWGLADEPLLLTVARLVPHKGQDVAIEAMARLRDEFPTLRYAIVGTGADEPRLRALAASRGVSDRLIFAGAVTDDEIAEAYATSSVYVGLSRVHNDINAEGFGISFVEAGASGVPSVAGDSGGVRSAVLDGETGLVVQPENVDQVVAALRQLLGDEPRRRRMGAAARQAVIDRLNWDRVARETIAFARDVALDLPRTAS